MASDRKRGGWNRIPINFPDGEDVENSAEMEAEDVIGADEESVSEDLKYGEPFETGDSVPADEVSEQPPKVVTGELGGPLTAELVATRSELKRVESELADLKDRLARRQADFENYRKRVERERTDTHDRVVAEVAAKLLPVLDNLKRALDAEASVEATESDEFRHFLSGVDLISKQLSGVLEALGVKPILAEGERFNPHIHEAVVTEPTDEYEPDTVLQEIIQGYRLGDKLIRPSLVKVAVKK
jgi:molecular chaperone GrpE